MAPGKSYKSSISSKELSYSDKLLNIYKKYGTITFGKSLLFDTSNLGIVSVAILFAELIINILVVQNVRYTEIDWIAYMQECEGFLNGTTNYSLLKGISHVYFHHVTRPKIDLSFYRGCQCIQLNFSFFQVILVL